MRRTTLIAICGLALVGCGSTHRSEVQELHDALAKANAVVERQTHGQDIVTIASKQVLRRNIERVNVLQRSLRASFSGKLLPINSKKTLRTRRGSLKTPDVQAIVPIKP